MRLENRFSDKPLCVPQSCARCTPGAADTASLLLVEEHVLTLFINGEKAHTFICSPAQLTELCIGWMTSEGFLPTPEDLLSLTISDDGSQANAQTAGRTAFEPAPFPVFHRPDPCRITEAMECLYGEGTVHSATHGTHGCVLIAEDGTALLFEDIGRYNAADKAIGAAVLQGRCMERCMLFSSGRVPQGMVLKMARSRIPVLISKAVTTVSAMETARNYRVTLCFSARTDTFFCHPDQTVFEGGADFE